MPSDTDTKKIACIGEAMVELTLNPGDAKSATVNFAGDTLNTAIYLKRLLGDQADIAFTSVLGNDPFSAGMLEFLHTEAINTQTISRSTTRQVGLYAITTDDAGERTFSYWRGESAARTLFQTESGDTDFSALNGFDVLSLSAITLAILPSAVREALINTLAKLRQQQGTQVVFDSNYRPALWESQAIAQTTVAEAWQVTDIALPSIDDEMALFNDPEESAVIKRLQSYGISRGALKRGADGPISLNAGTANNITPAIANGTPIDVVDTTAAGDSFNAGYLSACLAGATERDALLAGHACATRVIGQPGAIVPKDKW